MPSRYQQNIGKRNRATKPKPGAGLSKEDLKARVKAQAEGNTVSESKTKSRSIVVIPKRKWVLDFDGSLATTHDVKQPIGFIPGNFNHVDEGTKKTTKSDQDDLVYKSAMAVATMPGKQVLMTAFMLWMSGSSLQIFSIMMLGMAFWTPIGRIFNLQKEFSKYSESGVDLTVPKLVYIGLNCVAIGVALMKCHWLGLLPTSAADWATDTAVKPALEFSSGGVVF